MQQADALTRRDVVKRRWLLALTTILAVMLATLAFAQAAARVGLPVRALEPLGPAFYAWHGDHGRMEQRLATRGDAARARSMLTLARSIAVREPLADQPWRALGLAQRQLGHNDDARAIMRAADRFSRRDPVVQAWLIDDAVRRNAVPDTLRHFDALLRTEPDVRDAYLTRLSAVLANPEARRDLARFVDAENPWFPAFSGIAVNRRGSIQPFAMLLRDARSLPDSPLQREIYAGVVTRLINEGGFDLLRQLYPRLPGAAAADLSSVSLAGAGDPLYVPIGWTVSDEPDRAATIVASADGADAGAIEAFAEPLVSGLVARRLVYPPAGARRLDWRVAERTPATGATATLALRCLDAVAVSGNLFTRGTSNWLTVPATCPVAMVELQLYGGTGRDPASLVIDRISFAEGTVTPRTPAR